MAEVDDTILNMCKNVEFGFGNGIDLRIELVGVGSLIKANRQIADKLREYRKSLISEAVTGKFKVPGVDESQKGA